MKYVVECSYESSLNRKVGFSAYGNWPSVGSNENSASRVSE